MLDRIDLTVHVPRIAFEKLRGDDATEASSAVRERIEEARQRQQHRFQNLAFTTNAEMRTQDVKTFCALENDAEQMLRSAHDRLLLSPRAVTRILKVSRTIADLKGNDHIALHHISEALQYRPTAEET